MCATSPKARRHPQNRYTPIHSFVRSFVRPAAVCSDKHPINFMCLKSENPLAFCFGAILCCNFDYNWIIVQIKPRIHTGFFLDTQVFSKNPHALYLKKKPVGFLKTCFRKSNFTSLVIIFYFQNTRF